MKIYEIKEDVIFYNDIQLHRTREFIFENNSYIEFINNKNRRFEIMKKITNNTCVEITEKDLKKKILETMYEKNEGVIE